LYIIVWFGQPYSTRANRIRERCTTPFIPEGLSPLMKAALSILLVEALSILLVADACCTGIPCGRI
jgi:hypothetical protein